jgi:hypothetical protein
MLKKKMILSESRFIDSAGKGSGSRTVMIERLVQNKVQFGCQDALISKKPVLSISNLCRDCRQKLLCKATPEKLVPQIRSNSETVRR